MGKRNTTEYRDRLLIRKPYWRRDIGSWYVRIVDMKTKAVYSRKLLEEAGGGKFIALSERKASLSRLNTASNQAAERVYEENIERGGKKKIYLFSDLAEIYLDHQKKKRDNGLMGQYQFRNIESVVNTLIRDFHKDCLNVVTTLRIKEYLIERKTKQGKPLSRRSKKLILSVLRGIFECGIDGEFYHRNPIKKGMLPKETGEPTKRISLTEQEAQRLLELAHRKRFSYQRNGVEQIYRPNESLRVYLAVGFLTGLRPETLRKIRFCDFRHKEGKIVIPAAFMKKRREHLLPLRSDLSLYIRQLKENRGADNYDRIVPLKSKVLWHGLKNLVRQFSQTIQEDDPERAEEMAFATLRVPRYSLGAWLGSRYPLPLLREILGHKKEADNVAVTLRYVNVSEEAKREALNSIGVSLEPFIATQRKAAQL